MSRYGVDAVSKVMISITFEIFIVGKAFALLEFASLTRRRIF